MLLSQVRQLERTVGLKDLTVAEMEGRLREMSATTFDGVFVWRISDFAKKRQDAIAGRAPAMFSPGNIVRYQRLEVFRSSVVTSSVMNFLRGVSGLRHLYSTAGLGALVSSHFLRHYRVKSSRDVSLTSVPELH